MTYTDPIGDMISRIRNAQMRLSNNVQIPGSKFRAKILEVLKKEGFISDFKTLSDSKNKGICNLSLSVESNNPAIYLYKKMGFKKQFILGNSWTMLKSL